MKVLVPIGRLLYSFIFVISSFKHFGPELKQYAAGHGVPMVSVLVPLAGLLILVGGVSIVLGYKAKCGAWLIVLFLVPVTLSMHNFWAITDPQEAQVQLIMFMKNISMLGAALLIAYFGSGPYSLKE